MQLKRLAYSIAGEKDDDRIEVCAVPSELFAMKISMMGYKPVEGWIRVGHMYFSIDSAANASR